MNLVSQPFDRVSSALQERHDFLELAEHNYFLGEGITRFDYGRFGESGRRQDDAASTCAAKNADKCGCDFVCTKALRVPLHFDQIEVPVQLDYAIDLFDDACVNCSNYEGLADSAPSRLKESAQDWLEKLSSQVRVGFAEQRCEVTPKCFAGGNSGTLQLQPLLSLFAASARFGLSFELDAG